MNVSRALALLFVLAVLPSCVAESDNPFARCTTTADCAGGQYCYRGFCIPEMLDGGGMVDGSADAGMADVPIGPDTGVDGGCPRVGENCNTSMPGVCAMGTRTCLTPAGECTRNTDPSRELCDRLDNDCDAAIDEDAAAECFTGTAGCDDVDGDGLYTCVGVCRAGIQACNDGSPGTCEGERLPVTGPDGCSPPGEPAVDDDCDGRVDEDCVCTDGEMRPCYGGPPGTAGTGLCMAGTLTCADGSFGACAGEVLPGTETCDNPDVDDDCDGVEDDVPGTGEPCDTGEDGVCADGETVCMGGDIRCVGPTMSAERCNALDDDCDGLTDEMFDLDSDENNCGVCGRACGAGRTCCGGECVSTASDTVNCGDCGTTCSGATSSCCGGVCHAPSDGECTGCGTTNCAAMGLDCCPPACVDFDNDPSNCGGCGATSPSFICGSGERCCGGVCVGDSDTHCGSCTACATDSQCCGTGTAASCVADLDPMHCGGCNTVCGSSETCCGGTACQDLMTSETDCGSCGVRCVGTQECSLGLCCPMGQHNDGGICCPAGAYNAGGICCANGLTNCGGTCYDLQTDEAHCGACTGSGTVCSGLAPRCCSGRCGLAGLCL